MNLKEAQNPHAPLARLKELLDECDRPRQQFAAEIRAIGEMDDNAGPRLRAARNRLDTAIANDQNREVIDAIAENPNLDREQQLAATLRLAHASSSRTSHFGLGTPSLADMVDAGVEVLHEPFLLDRCQKSIDDTLRKIRTGKLLVGDASVVVKGMPDFTGDLAEGEIMLIVDGKHSQPLALRGIDNDTASGGGGQRGRCECDAAVGLEAAGRARRGGRLEAPRERREQMLDVGGHVLVKEDLAAQHALGGGLDHVIALELHIVEVARGDHARLERVPVAGHAPALW
jgi:hypothetical protein